MSGLARRYSDLKETKVESLPYKRKSNKEQKNPFISICCRKNCNALVYVNERIAYEKELCLKHYDLYVKKYFKSVTQQNKNKTCKNCNKKIESKRNKFYCSAACRQQASRKIRDISIEKLVKSLEWQKVERLIKSSPLGLNSINHEENLDDLYRLFILCYFEIKNKQHNKDFTFYHVIPLRFGGKNTLDNIIIAPGFIKRSMNLSLIGTSDFIKGKKPIYIKDNIIDTCLNNKNLKGKIVDLIEEINLNFDFNTNGNLIEKGYDSRNNKSSFINSIRDLLSFKFNKYSSDSLLHHLELQRPFINQETNLYSTKEINDLYGDLNLNDDLSSSAKTDFLNLVALMGYIWILNYTPSYIYFWNKIKKDINQLKKMGLFNQAKLDKINKKLIFKIWPKIKLYSKRPDTKMIINKNYKYIESLYETHKNPK